MKVIIAGSRTITDHDIVRDAIASSGFSFTEVISGGAPGVDTLAERWADRHGIPVTQFPADWKRYGRKAGPIRNAQMAEYADALIALWDGKSKGTQNIISLARRRGLRVYIHRVVIQGHVFEARGPQLGLCVGWA